MQPGFSKKSVAGWVVAGVLLAILICEAISTRSIFQSHDQDNHYGYRADTYCGPKLRSHIMHPPAYGEPDRTSPEDQRQYELCQQWRSARASEEAAKVAWIQFAAGVAGLIGLLVTIALTAKSARAATDAAIATRATLIASQRAWIKPAFSSKTQMRFVESGTSWAIGVIAKNIGNTPATGVTIHAWLLPSEHAEIPIREHRRRCAEVRGNPAISIFGVTIFPEDEYPERTECLANAWLNRTEQDKATDPNTGYVQLYVGGCINYTFQTDATRNHQTGFFFALNTKDRGPIRPADGDLPEGSVVLMPFAGGIGSHVD